MSRAKKSASKSAPKKAPASKAVAKKAAAKKPSVKKAPKKDAKKAAKKDAKKAPKKDAKKAAKIDAKKAAKIDAKKAPKKDAKKAAKIDAKKARDSKKESKKADKKAPKKKTSRKALAALPELFAPLTEGERAETLRILLEDMRLANMAKVGRYRVIAVEPLALKSPHELASHRIARVVIYDYSADRCVESNIDLDTCEVQFLSVNKSQPMLSADEEMAAMEIALSDENVLRHLNLGELPQAAMHYWSNRPSDTAHNRRTAAVLFGQPDTRPSLIAVVDFLDGEVTEIVPAQHW